MGFHLITNSKSSNQYPIIAEKRVGISYEISRLRCKYIIEYVTMKKLRIGSYCTNAYLLNHTAKTHVNFSAAAMYYKRHYYKIRLKTLEKYRHTYIITQQKL